MSENPPSPRPEIDRGRFAVHRGVVRGQELAWIDEGPRDAPLVLLVHGWPETMRIWWRNVAVLADAGLRVLAPDLRGFGASRPAADGRYDVAAHARDLAALVTEVAGRTSCTAVGGDLGGAVIQDLGPRFPGLVERQILFNCPLPYLKEEMRGLVGTRPHRETMDYYLRQGTEADALAAELDDPAKRRRYIAQFYGPRLWAAPGSFDEEAVDFMTEPFADGELLRAGFANYETTFDASMVHEKPLLGRSDIPTMILVGSQDHVIYPGFAEMAARVFSVRFGPLLVAEAGHFLQWEAPDVTNAAICAFVGAPLPRSD